MPSNFAQVLPTQGPTSYAQGDPPSTTGPVIAQSVAAVAGALAAAKKQGILGSLAAEAQGVVTEASRYQKVKDDIVSRTTGADQATMSSLADDLRRIRNGEVQGVIGPSEANIRLQALARTYINRYPRLAGDIRQILSAVSGDIAPDTKPGDITDPFLKEQYELVEEAAGQGTTVDDIRAKRLAASNRQLAEDELNMAVALGSKDVPKLMAKFFDKSSEQIFGEIISNMTVQINTGTFVKEDQIGFIQKALARATQTMEAKLTEYELSTGRQVDHTLFINRMKRSFEPLIAMISQVDSLDKALRISEANTKIMQNADIAYYHEVFGALGPIVYNNPEAGFRVLQVLATTIDKIQHGQYASWEKLAELSPEAALYLSLMKRSGEPFETILNKVKSFIDGVPIANITPVPANSLAEAIALEQIAMPGRLVTEASQDLQNYMTGGGSATGLLYTTKLHPLISKSTVAQNAIAAEQRKQAISFVESQPLSVLRNIEIDPADKEMPFKLIAPLVPGPTSGKGDAPQNFIAIQARELNAYYNLMKLWMTPEEAVTEVISQFQTLVANKAKNEMIAAHGISTSQAGGPPRDRDKQEDEEETVTDVGEQVTGKRYDFDEEQGLIIDLKNRRVIPDTYEWSPQELEQLYRDVPITRPAQ